jgi:mono/diheme cytochrome c family protein
LGSCVLTPVIMLHLRFVAFLLLAFLGLGCGESPLPPFTTVPASSASAGRYPLRSDFMVVGKTGLDGAPRQWPSAGFPPMKSARTPAATPDRDLAADIRNQLGRTVLDPSSKLTHAQSALTAELLEANFGTPAEPRVRVPDWNEVTIDAVVRPEPKLGVIKNLKAAAAALKRWKPAPVKADWDSANAVKAELKLTDAVLARGSVLYRRWCMQCHGPSGAGDGAHAIELAAMPRDYRQGIFKFVTAFPTPGQAKRGGLSPAGKPHRDDLTRTIRKGIDGSMMPAFPTLAESELDDLVSYVIHLSIRGETEFTTMNKAMNPTEDDPEVIEGAELRWIFDKNLMWVLHNWGVAQRSTLTIPPENTPTAAARLASAARGAQRYTEFGCAACHVNYGREPQLKWDLWGGVAQPRNLALGVYRGGRRGEDLYARIYGGIYPSGMPAHFDRLAGGTSDPDQPDKIWDLVHFLQALSDPADRDRVRDLVRKTDPAFKIDP